VNDWRLSWRADPKARVLADRHYSRQKVGAAQFVPPGRSVELLTERADALWVTSWPYAEYVHRDWKDAWLCSLFRNESELLSSELIREAVAITRGIWPEVPTIGMVTFVDRSKVKSKRDPGRCFTRAGFRPAICYAHAWLDLIMDDCSSCQGRTKGGLLALQLLPEDMPPPLVILDHQPSLWEGVS